MGYYRLTIRFFDFDIYEYHIPVESRLRYVQQNTRISKLHVKYKVQQYLLKVHNIGFEETKTKIYLKFNGPIWIMVLDV